MLVSITAMTGYRIATKSWMPPQGTYEAWYAGAYLTWLRITSKEQRQLELFMQKSRARVAGNR